MVINICTMKNVGFFSFNTHVRGITLICNFIVVSLLVNWIEWLYWLSKDFLYFEFILRQFFIKEAIGVKTRQWLMEKETQGPLCFIQWDNVSYLIKIVSFYWCSNYLLKVHFLLLIVIKVLTGMYVVLLYNIYR